MDNNGNRLTYAELEAENVALREQVTNILHDALNPATGYAWEAPAGVAWIGSRLLTLDALEDLATAFSSPAMYLQNFTGGEVASHLRHSMQGIQDQLPARPEPQSEKKILLPGGGLVAPLQH